MIQTNADRADIAELALVPFVHATRHLPVDRDLGDPNTCAEVVGDLIADLCHFLVVRHGLDPAPVATIGFGHFNAEIIEQLYEELHDEDGPGAEIVDAMARRLSALEAAAALPWWRPLARLKATTSATVATDRLVALIGRILAA